MNFTKINNVKKVLFLALACFILIAIIAFFIPTNASAHATYIGQRFGYEDGHHYVEFDIYYSQDWNCSNWVIIPSTVMMQKLKPWANPTDGKLRVGITGVGPLRFGSNNPNDYLAYHT